MSQKYISKQEALQKGLIKKDGVFYKQSLLEIWYAKGWLDLPTSRFAAEDRLRFGLKLALDYYTLQRATLHSGHSVTERVDGESGTSNLGILSAGDRYGRIIRQIPSEFWPVVKLVCLEEKEPKAPENLSERQKTYFYYLCRTDLCRGLDRLIEAYTHRLKIKNI